MRILISLLLFAFPAAAWEFSPTPICTMTHVEAGVEVMVTYDVSIPEYAITLTTSQGWPDAPQFNLAFEGARGMVLSTDRQILSDDGQSLTVADVGFGNVLDGLAFNETATGVLGDASVTFSLDDAARAVAASRECPAVVTS